MWDVGFVVVRATDHPPVAYTHRFIYPLLILYVSDLEMVVHIWLSGGTQRNLGIFPPTSN